MARAQVRHNVKDAAGNVIQNAKVFVYEQGTTTPVADLFTALTGGAAVGFLTSDSQGEVLGYLTTSRLVDLSVTDNAAAAFYPATPGSLRSWTAFTETVETPSSATSQQIANLPVIYASNPKYGLVNDTTWSLDQTTGLNLAIADAAGGKLVLPAWFIRVSSVDFSGVVQVEGAGVTIATFNFYGNAQWATAAAFVASGASGTWIICTKTTAGACVNVTQQDLNNFGVLGPGSGTSTGIVATGTGRRKWPNIVVANFSKNITCESVIGNEMNIVSVASDLRNIEMNSSCNANDLTIDSEYPNTYGLYLQGNSNRVKFLGQGATATGQQLRVDGGNNDFLAPYLENVAGFNIQADVGGIGNIFRAAITNTAQDNYRFTGTDNVLEYPVNDKTTTVTGARTKIIGPTYGTLTITGTGQVIRTPDPDRTPHTFSPAAYTGDALVFNNVVILRARDSGTISKIGLWVGVQSGNIEVGVLRASSGVAVPTTRVITSGSVACPAIGYREIALGASVYVNEQTDYLYIAADNNLMKAGVSGVGGQIKAAWAKGLAYFQTVYPCPSPAAPTVGDTAPFILVGLP